MLKCPLECLAPCCGVWVTECLASRRHSLHPPCWTALANNPEPCFDSESLILIPITLYITVLSSVLHWFSSPPGTWRSNGESASQNVTHESTPSVTTCPPSHCNHPQLRPLRHLAFFFIVTEFTL